MYSIDYDPHVMCWFWASFLSDGWLPVALIHRYCSNYYVESSEAGPSLCDWCRSEERSSKVQGGNSKRPAGKDAGAMINRSEYSGERIKNMKNGEENSDRGKNEGSSPSPRTSGRKYKLLKDVLCWIRRAKKQHNLSLCTSVFFC